MQPPESAFSSTAFPGTSNPGPAIPAPRAQHSRLPQTIRVVLVSPNRLLVAALTLALARTAPLQVVRSHELIQNARADLVHLDPKPDVLVVDLDGGGGDSADEVRSFCEAWPCVRVVMTSVPPDLAVVLAFVEAGARGLLTVDSELHQLVSAIRTVAQGEAACSPAIVTVMLEALAHGPASARGMQSSLTPRERQVVRLLERGLSNKEIARQLDIKVATVKNHVHNILSKLELSNRSRVRGLTRPGSR